MQKEENDGSKQAILKENFKKLLETDYFKVPQAKDIVKGTVISASKSEVKLDISGFMTGVVRGEELYDEAPEYADLKPGDEVEATVIETENENGELELSFRYAGQEKAWSDLKEAFAQKLVIKVKVSGANRGGLLASYKQIAGFLPVSQLAPENYPRISGGDKSRILEKLRSFIGREFEAKVSALDDKGEKIIFSEKDAWIEKRQDVISQYKIGTVIEGKVTAVTDFGIFITFGEGLEGLIHISELAWQRVDDPNDLFKAGDSVKAEIISIEGPKIFLSAKKLTKDPWEKVAEKYQIGQEVKGKILKVNLFGLFVELDSDIHGLAHISQLGLAGGEKVSDKFKEGEERVFSVISVDSKAHRLGLAPVGALKVQAEKEDKEEAEKPEINEEKPEETEKKEEAEKTKKQTKPKAGHLAKKTKKKE